MRRALAAVVACAFAFAVEATGLARHAWASSPAFALEYDAPATCPSETTFVAEVRARTAGRPTPASDERRFRVRIGEDGGRYHGALETIDPRSVRDVGGETCEEVVRALVVFLALAVSAADPGDAAGEPPPPPPREPTPPRVEPAPRNAAAGAIESRRPVRPRLGVDLRGVAVGGVTPGIAPGGAVAGRLVLETSPSFRWIAQVGGMVAYDEEPVLDGAFVFLWYAARVDAGPALELGRFRISGGPAVRAGVLSAKARGLPAAAQYSSFWGDAGVFTRLDFAVSSSVALSTMVELAAPLQRRTFGIQGIEEPIHEIAPLVGIVSAGVTLGR